ncbi:hypothetical protein ENSA5_03210 [Enhygromyxa salina]|uniref:Uncharacterized protein n=1 Tax=Enhygromyxa salina TaxID=215803 RepID=A0A2S9YJS8_9BACT|nr:hypothetical protein [Enhygromyxa salina]PRQ05331.1 hypothetical protein ENSA5_03210 [Enhygromyxa salina]
MTGFNPYAPPSAESDGPSDLPGTGEPLFTDAQVAGATFLGSPIAGFIVLAINERRMGRTQRFGKTVVVGVLASVAVFALALVIPPEVPNFVLTLAYLFGMQQLARHWQGEELMERLSSGTTKGSNWVIVGVGVACFAAVVGLAFGLFLLAPSLFPDA